MFKFLFKAELAIDDSKRERVSLSALEFDVRSQTISKRPRGGIEFFAMWNSDEILTSHEKSVD